MTEHIRRCLEWLRRRWLEKAEEKAMPSGVLTARLASGVRLRYEVTEPPEGTKRKGRVVVTPGGKQGVDGARTMARMMAERGFLVMTHDRRGTGLSSWGIREHERRRGDDGAPLPEPITHALDTVELVALAEGFNPDGGDAEPPHWLGESSGARMSIFAAAYAPSAVQKLVCTNLTAGPLAAETIARAYHGGNAAIAESGGWDALCKMLPRMRVPAVRDELREVGLEAFIAFSRAEAAFLSSNAPDGEPLVALPARVLSQVRAPALGVRAWPGPEDGMHTLAAMESFASLVPGATLFVVPPEAGASSLALALDHAAAFLVS